MPTPMSVIQIVVESLAGGLKEGCDLEDEFFENYLPRQSEAAQQLIFDLLVAAESLEGEELALSIKLLKRRLAGLEAPSSLPDPGLAQHMGLSAASPRIRSV